MKLIFIKNSFLFIIGGFLISIFFGTILLMLPKILQNGSLSLVNALFISVSSVTCTGISPIPINLFSHFGKITILMLMYIGSIGLLTLFLTAVFYFASNNVAWYGLANEILEIIAIRQFLLFFKIIFLTSVTIIFFGTCFFYFFINYSGCNSTYIDSLFITMNLFCNAGFTLTGWLPNKIINSVTFYIISSFLIIIGSIGFLSLFEIIQYKQKKSINQRYTFSITFQLMIKMYIITTLSAWIFYVIFCESEYQLLNICRSLFASISLRGCGISPYSLIPNSIIFISAMYGILGTGPLGTGGGIKTGITGIIFYTFISFFKKDKNVIINNKKVSWGMVAYAHIFLIYIIILPMLLSLIIDLYYKYNIDFLLIYSDILGLITGSGALWTPFIEKVTTPMKIIGILIMCFAKISTILFSLSLNKLKKNTIQYSEAKIIII